MKRKEHAVHLMLLAIQETDRAIELAQMNAPRDAFRVAMEASAMINEAVSDLRGYVTFEQAATDSDRTRKE